MTTTDRHLLARALAAGLALSFTSFIAAQPPAEPAPPAATPAPAPVPQLTPEQQAAFDADVVVFNDHLITLANPMMEGRLPGTRGMEIATDYFEHCLQQAGVRPAFDLVETVDGQQVVKPSASYRQAFPLGSSVKVTDGSLRAGTESFVRGTDFSVTGYGTGASVTGEAVFVGYAVDNADEGYAAFADDALDLTGKIALMLRFEPMTDEGKSKWGGTPWTPRAGFAGKLERVMAKKPAAVIILNPPGAADERINQLASAESSSEKLAEVPVFMMTPEAGDRLVRAVDPAKRSLLDLRKAADAAGVVETLGAAPVALSASMESTTLVGENVGGVVPGRGSLKDEWIVIGAHLDHLGMGYFGSRSGPGKLHPGADDNASGSAAILMLALSLQNAMNQLSEGANARSILLVGFSGEESGLNGSSYYVNNPIAPLENHKLMINFDMIGRILNRRLSVSGVDTAEGMHDWLKPLFADSGLEVVTNPSGGGGSDHVPFQMRSVPVLFGIIADFHADYHTPEDVSSKINREDAVRTTHLFHKVAMTAATRNESFVFRDPGGAAGRPGGRMAGLKVRFGIAPGSYDKEDGGVLINTITKDGTAEAAGLQAGDVIVSWNDQPVKNVEGWMELMRTHEPGDVVKVGVKRGDTAMTVEATLKPRGG